MDRPLLGRGIGACYCNEALIQPEQGAINLYAARMRGASMGVETALLFCAIRAVETLGTLSSTRDTRAGADIALQKFLPTSVANVGLSSGQQSGRQARQKTFSPACPGSRQNDGLVLTLISLSLVADPTVVDGGSLVNGRAPRPRLSGRRRTCRSHRFAACW